jgi:hypothetical protein
MTGWCFVCQRDNVELKQITQRLTGRHTRSAWACRDEQACFSAYCLRIGSDPNQRLDPRIGTA